MSKTLRRVAIVALSIGLLAISGPALAGQDLTIELQNNLKPSQPLYPKLRLQGTGNLCWYANDFSDGPSAPAGGGYANVGSEVQNTFFSYCNPTWNPLGGGFTRWQQFELQSQAQPGAGWKPVTWGAGSRTLLLTYSKFPMDTRGYHFQLVGPRGNVLDTPAGPACMTIAPLGVGFNFSNLYRMKVTPTADQGCTSEAVKRMPTTTRTVRIGVGRTKPVVLGQVVSRSSSRWAPQRCSSRHYTVSDSRVAKGPGRSRWQVVDVAALSRGTDHCVISLSAPGGEELLTQRIKVVVR